MPNSSDRTFRCRLILPHQEAKINDYLGTREEYFAMQTPSLYRRMMQAALDLAESFKPAKPSIPNPNNETVKHVVQIIEKDTFYNPETNSCPNTLGRPREHPDVLKAYAVGAYACPNCHNVHIDMVDEMGDVIATAQLGFDAFLEMSAGTDHDIAQLTQPSEDDPSI